MPKPPPCLSLRNWYRGMVPKPFTSTLARTGYVAPRAFANSCWRKIKKKNIIKTGAAMLTSVGGGGDLHGDRRRGIQTIGKDGGGGLGTYAGMLLRKTPTQHEEMTNHH